jgi:hypothetical protein
MGSNKETKKMYVMLCLLAKPDVAQVRPMSCAVSKKAGISRSAMFMETGKIINTSSTHHQHIINTKCMLTVWSSSGLHDPRIQLWKGSSVAWSAGCTIQQRGDLSHQY